MIRKMWVHISLILALILCTGIVCPVWNAVAEESHQSLKNDNSAENNETQDTDSSANFDVDIKSPSAILMEAESGQVIYEKNCDTAMAPASVTKVMTLLLTFEAIDDGKFSLDDTVVVSDHAASMGGSQCFFESGEEQTVQDMIKCIIIASGNDAAVAMAEKIAG